MQITLFKNARNTASENIEIDWQTLCTFSADMAEIEKDRADKLDHYALIFGRCNGRRSNANIEFLSGLCADFDTPPTSPDYVEFSKFCEKLDAQGYAYIGYATTNNNLSHNKFRLIMPYAANVAAEIGGAAWHKCNDKFGGRIDPATKDVARLSFLPARWIGGCDSLARPFNALRIGSGSKPILDHDEIANLTPFQRDAPNALRYSCAQVAQLTQSQATQLAHGYDGEASCWTLLASLQHSPIVTKWMRDDLPQSAGNRDYRFLSFAADNAISKNLPINVETLIVLAEQFSIEKLNRHPPTDIVRQAENALSWAYQNSSK